jgi:hypothetical protein
MSWITAEMRTNTAELLAARTNRGCHSAPPLLSLRAAAAAAATARARSASVLLRRSA